MTRPIFLNTRPSTRLADLPKVAKLADVVQLPLLELVPRVLDKDEWGFLDKLADGDYAVLVVVSITAVECACRLLDDQILNKIKQLNQTGQLTIVAVGKPTQTALTKLGLTAIMPPIASNESMSQMAVFLQAGRVLFWRGVGGRVFLLDFLREQGKTVDFVNFYDRQIPLNLPQTLAKLIDTSRPLIVLISSEMAYRAWQAVAAKLSLSCQFIAMGDRLGAMTGGVVVMDLTDKSLAGAVERILSTKYTNQI